jgi:hypothetical protein
MNEDETDPVINYIEPVQDLVINLPDTIGVKVQITDERLIASVVLTMVNEDKIPVIPSTYYYPNSDFFTIETFLILDDKAMATGDYEIQVSATDGENTKLKYRAIHINEIPAQILGYVSVTAPASKTSKIVKLNPAFEADTQFVIPEARWLTGVHGLWGNFFFITGEPSRLTAYDPVDFEIGWEMEASQPRPLFTAIITDTELLLATANGDACILSQDGDIMLRTAAFENKSIQCLAADDKYIFASHVSLGGDIHELTVYYRVTGEIRVQQLVSGEIRSMAAVNGNVILFMPSESGAGILEYDPAYMSPAQIGFLENENLDSVVKISDSQLFLLTDRCVISYDLPARQFEDFTSRPYDFCRYDKLSDIIYLGKDTAVYGFDRISGNPLNRIDFPEKVVDFQILYNK